MCNIVTYAYWSCFLFIFGDRKAYSCHYLAVSLHSFHFESKMIKQNYWIKTSRPLWIPIISAVAHLGNLLQKTCLPHSRPDSYSKCAQLCRTEMAKFFLQQFPHNLMLYLEDAAKRYFSKWLFSGSLLVANWSCDSTRQVPCHINVTKLFLLHFCDLILHQII